jgi:hypothetical protein
MGAAALGSAMNVPASSDNPRASEVLINVFCIVISF